LLCMGPPTFDAKCDGIHAFYDAAKETPSTEAAGKTLRELCPVNSWTREQLNLYTFGEFKPFIEKISPRPEDLNEALRKIPPSDFERLVKEDARTVTLRFDDAEELLKKNGRSKISDFDSPAVEVDVNRVDAAIKDGQMTRYIQDRKESRI